MNVNSIDNFPDSENLANSNAEPAITAPVLNQVELYRLVHSAAGRGSAHALRYGYNEPARLRDCSSARGQGYYVN